MHSNYFKKLKKSCFQRESRISKTKWGYKHKTRKKALQIQKEEKGTTNTKRQKKKISNP